MELNRYYRPGPNKPISVACLSCNQRTLHVILYEAAVEHVDDGTHFATDEYQLVECRGCQTISFRHNSQNSEDVEDDPDGVGYVPVDHEILYPSRLVGAKRMNDSHLLPAQLNRIYDETHAAVNAGLAVLAGIGIRAIVETLCVERNAKGRDLAKKIDDLVHQGVTTVEGAKILHSLRLMGNKAAHEVKPHTPAQLLTAMSVVEHALQGVYILPKKAQTL